MRNKYAAHAKISEAKTRQLVRLFAEDWDATSIARELKVNRNTVNRFMRGIRESIMLYCEKEMYEKKIICQSSLDYSEYAKKRLKKFRGVSGKMAELHKYECMFRFVCQGKMIYHYVLKILRSNPI